MTPTNRFKLIDGAITEHFWEYKLTQYETQFYQNPLLISIIVENDDGIISTQPLELEMTKQRYNKLTPVNLEDDGTLKSVVTTVSSLDRLIDERIESAEESILDEVKELDQSVKTELNNTISIEVESLNTRIVGVEDYYNSEISRVESDINDAKLELQSTITDAVNEMTGYTDRTVQAYNEYAHDIFITGDDVQQDLYPYIDRKTAEAKDYADEKIAELVDSAPETLDTIREIAEALTGQDDIITALEESIGNKADRSEVDGKVDKIEYSSQLYATDSTGLPASISYNEYDAQAGTIPVRNSGGNIAVGEIPYADNDATSKKYVDNSIGNKLDKVTTSSRVYVTDSSGNQTTKEYVTNTPKASAVPIYNAYGNLQGYTAKNPYDLTNKTYVDSLFAGSVIERSESIISGLNMVNNTQYKCLTPLTTLDIDTFEAGTTGIGEQWSIIFTTAGAVTVSLPENVKWAVAEPVFNPNKTYMLTFIRFLDNYLGVWTVV